MPWDRIQSRWRRPYYRPTSNEATFNNDYADVDGLDAQLYVPESELDGGDATPDQLDVVLDGGIANQP